MRHFDTVVVSDLHLGARNARTHEFQDFLASVRADHLIINGDLFEDPQLRGLKPSDVAVLEELRRYGRNHKLTLLRGNHDPDQSWYNGVLGLPVYDERVLDVGGRTYLICHGHTWDRAMQLPALVIAIADAFYAGSQWLDPSHRLAKLLKRKCKTFCKAVHNLRMEAVQVAHTRNFAGVILGHTHIQEDVQCKGIHYLNSGCWTERPSGYIGIRGSDIQIYNWVTPNLELPALLPPRNSLELDTSKWELAGI